jgi:hypothetical protein
MTATHLSWKGTKHLPDIGATAGGLVEQQSRHEVTRRSLELGMLRRDARNRILELVQHAAHGYTSADGQDWRRRRRLEAGGQHGRCSGKSKQ